MYFLPKYIMYKVNVFFILCEGGSINDEVIRPMPVMQYDGKLY